MRQWMMLPLLALGSCATTPEQRLAEAQAASADAAKLSKALAGLAPAGPPQQCISERRANYSTTTIGDTILYRFSRDEVYRTEAPGCGGAARGDALILVNYQAGLLCAGQIIQTVDIISRIQTGSCALGQFTPYRRSKS